jgi:RND family efflux transporter MFP subunit
MRGRIAAAALLALAAATGCRGKGDAPEKLSERPPAAVETVTIAPREVVDGIDVIGTLAPKVQADIKSEISGKVAEVLVLEWAHVRKGNPLARIDTSEVEALLHKAQAAGQAAAAASESARAGLESVRMSAAEAKVALDRAEREYERQRGLKDSGLATQQALDEALSQKEASAARLGSLRGQGSAAEAQVRLAEAQQAVAAEEVRQVEARMAKAVVRAPFDGVVAARLVNVGEVVGEMQKVIFRLVDNSVLDLTVQVPVRLAAAVRAGEPLTFSADTLPGRSFSGAVKYLNPAVDEADRSVRVVAEVPNPGGELRGGIFVKGRIETGRRPAVLLVPRLALLEWDTAAARAAVLALDGDRARRREVRTGELRGEEVEVVSGLAAGDRVISRGGFTVRDGERVSVAAAGK